MQAGAAEQVLGAVTNLSREELAAKGGQFVMAARQVGGAEQVLDVVSNLSPAELAAKGGQYVEAALSAGGAEQLVAAATTLSRAELLAKTHQYLLTMARASEQCDGADGVTDGIYKGFAGSPKHVLADYIVETRQIRQGGRAAGETAGEARGAAGETAGRNSVAGKTFRRPQLHNRRGHRPC